MVYSKACQIGWLKMIFVKNYKVDLDLVDWDSLVDGRLNYSENFFILFGKLKQRGLINENFSGYTGAETFVAEEQEDRVH